MKGKVKLKQIIQKVYEPIIWVKEPSQPKGKAQIGMSPSGTRAQAEARIEEAKERYGDNLFFTDIKEQTVTLEGEFYIDRGYYS